MKVLYFLSVCISLLSCKKNDEYQIIGKEFQDRNFLIKNIIPNKKGIEYWKYVETSSNRVVKESGNKKLLQKYNIKIPENGFFSECTPGYCFSYILYIDENGIQYVTSNNDLKKFIGDIDNLSEALLIGKTQGYWFDTNNKKGGSFKKDENGYNLFLLEYNGCPETYQSIFFQINFKGNFKITPKEIYKQTSNCVVS